MKKTIAIPYYTSTLDLHVEEENLKAVITAKMHEFKTDKSEVELVKEALENPIGTPATIPVPFPARSPFRLSLRRSAREIRMRTSRF